MTWLNSHPLSFLVFAPALLGFAILALPQTQARLARMVGFMGAIAVFLLSLSWLLGHGGTLAPILAERAPWFTLVGLPVDYSLCVDGLNLWLVLLTTFLVPLTMLGTWNSLKDRIGTFAALFLMLETGMLGALMAQDLFFFYLFWEAMLIPMYFMIGVWGGDERRYAATKFFLYTLAGSLLWLVALLYLAGKAGSFNPAVMGPAASALPFSVQCWLFLAFAVAFAIKVPLFPLHTWLPDAHVQAPTAGSVILAGVLLKLGGYGFIRFAIPMFPDAAMHYAKPLALLSVIAIVYGALVAMVQRDIKKLVAYSSVSHMGFVMLGLAAANTQAVAGAVLQMFSHGVIAGLLFAVVGRMIYERTHTRQLGDLRRLPLHRLLPFAAVVFVLAGLASLGLPGFSGFPAELTILIGTWQASPRWALGAAVGVLVAAAFTLRVIQVAFFSRTEPADTAAPAEALPPITLPEKLGALLLLSATVLIGLKPDLLLDWILPALQSPLMQAVLKPGNL